MKRSKMNKTMVGSIVIVCGDRRGKGSDEKSECLPEWGNL